MTSDPRGLLSAAAVRARCADVQALIERGDSPWWRWHPARIDDAAAITVATIRDRYPDLRVPFHSRWRHFEAAGCDRWRELAAAAGLGADPVERARTMVDLVIPSVLLDAGAGAAWRFQDRAHELKRSEGLAVASLRWFAAGGWSAEPSRPLRADAAALSAVQPAALARAFQVDDGNPLPGVANRAGLLSRLGAAIRARPDVFSAGGRLGNLVDHLRAVAGGGRLDADRVLQHLLDWFGPIWPGRLEQDGIPLGDTWRHPAAEGGLVPFHKLSQWLAYSLLEPLAEAGLVVERLDGLTGLPEYRNGGLLLDTGVLVARDSHLSTTLLAVDHPAVVEWRAATVIGLDRIAAAVRRQLGVAAADFPLARVLEGGTWAAGRRLAAERRAGSQPPLQIASDGTVF